MRLFCFVFLHFQFHTEVLSLKWSLGYWGCGVHVKYIFHLKIWVLSKDILVNFGISRMGRPRKIWGSYQKRRSTLEASSPLIHCYDWTRFLHLVISPFLFACRNNSTQTGCTTEVWSRFAAICEKGKLFMIWIQKWFLIITSPNFCY